MQPRDCALLLLSLARANWDGAVGDTGPIVSLNSIDEVRTLHRMLMDRKFDGPEDVFFGSPFIAAIQHRLVDALAAAEPTKDWDAWRDASRHPEKIDKVRQHLADLSDWWKGVPPAQREEHVRTVLAPLLLGKELLHELTGDRVT